jgi:hypothetical protein
LTNENVGDISKSSGSWIGKFDPLFAGQWTDLFVAMVNNLFFNYIQAKDTYYCRIEEKIEVNVMPEFATYV